MGQLSRDERLLKPLLPFLLFWPLMKLNGSGTCKRRCKLRCILGNLLSSSICFFKAKPPATKYKNHALISTLYTMQKPSRKQKELRWELHKHKRSWKVMEEFRRVDICISFNQRLYPQWITDLFRWKSCNLTSSTVLFQKQINQLAHSDEPLGTLSK